MRTTPKKPVKDPAKESLKDPPGGLLPAILADTEINHIERMVQYVSRARAAQLPHSTRGIDAGYWKKRLRVLESNYDLVAMQRSRVARLRELLDLLDGSAQPAKAPRRDFVM